MRMDHDLVRTIMQRIGDLPFDGDFHVGQVTYVIPRALSNLFSRHPRGKNSVEGVHP